MSLYREPPESVTVQGKEYPIETDFRRWIEFQGMLVAKEDDVKKAERLCGFMESLGLPPLSRIIGSHDGILFGSLTGKAGSRQSKAPGI